MVQRRSLGALLGFFLTAEEGDQRHKTPKANQCQQEPKGHAQWAVRLNNPLPALWHRPEYPFREVRGEVDQEHVF